MSEQERELALVMSDIFMGMAIGMGAVIALAVAGLIALMFYVHSGR